MLCHQSTVSGNGPQDESVAQQKVEATSENNPTSNHSSDHVACIQKNKEEELNKVSDAQVSVSHFLDIFFDGGDAFLYIYKHLFIIDYTFLLRKCNHFMLELSEDS